MRRILHWVPKSVSMIAFKFTVFAFRRDDRYQCAGRLGGRFHGDKVMTTFESV